MNALDLILLVAGMTAAAAVMAGGVVCLVVWFAGGPEKRASEVCPASRKS
ncbi:hypothetical protein Verru16b_03280 [Lacunisphaera limnophila]|uniref:Uncharacterized protein n=1 Tax=Lacunisphaera limnophila TaxID=1838286 RepID=A0A1D8AZ58_9BACT|nr:hypothetical protein [Lacunisphaera limnophila]AOS46183.1 hypothetical protein Verru16b_03280 [Lacunisphaera limnophila]